jgi:hypothetical protein
MGIFIQYNGHVRCTEQNTYMFAYWNLERISVLQAKVFLLNQIKIPVHQINKLFTNRLFLNKTDTSITYDESMT